MRCGDKSGILLSISAAALNLAAAAATNLEVAET
jgi:hypothetical protein